MRSIPAALESTSSPNSVSVHVFNCRKSMASRVLPTLLTLVENFCQSLRSAHHAARKFRQRSAVMLPSWFAEAASESSAADAYPFSWGSAKRESVVLASVITSARAAMNRDQYALVA